MSSYEKESLDVSIDQSDSTTKKTIEEKKIEKKETKKKKKRRTNSEIHNKSHKCKYCAKEYTDRSSLNTHNKRKHADKLEFINKKRKRGRPKKESEAQVKTKFQKAEEEFNSFFEKENRRPESFEQSNNNEISLKTIEQLISDVFKEYYKKYEDSLYMPYEKVEDYPLYKIIKENWNKEKLDIVMESLLDYLSKPQKRAIIEKTDSPCIDDLFFLYLKEFSRKTNKYFFDKMVKFVYLLRGNINHFKKNVIDNIKSNKNNNNYFNNTEKEYSQIYSGEEISKFSNDFLMHFLELNDYCQIGENEAKDLMRHLCFWFLEKKYTSSFLILNNQ